MKCASCDKQGVYWRSACLERCLDCYLNVAEPWRLKYSTLQMVYLFKCWRDRLRDDYASAVKHAPTLPAPPFGQWKKSIVENRVAMLLRLRKEHREAHR